MTGNVAPISVAGTKRMEPLSVKAGYTRKLVRHESSSIHWFGVAIPWRKG